MTTILDYSDEPKYTIKTVCSQTGIRAVTLRAWERRHGLLNPYRSENRYRYYSERDVQVLRWVKNRVDEGVSISSAVSEFKSMSRNGIWPEAIPAAPTTLPVRQPVPAEQYALQLFQALIHHKEAEAGNLFREVQARFDLMTLFTEMITPALVEIGNAWYHGEIRITTEHFASTFIRGKLLSLLQAYPTRRSSAYILLGAAPGEQHEIGSLMMAVLLRSQGYRVEYLGTDIPLDDLVDYASFEHPDLILLTASLEPAALELASFQEKLARIRPAPGFAYAGRAFDRKPELSKMVPGIYLGQTMEEGVAAIRSLLQRRSSFDKSMA